MMVTTVGTAAFIIGLVYPAHWVIAASSYLWARVVLACAGVRLTVVGVEHVQDGHPRFFVGNHQSALDIPILLVALRGRVRFMAKDGLFRIPIFGWVIRRYGYAPIYRRQVRLTWQVLEQTLARLRSDPVSFAVFPEGTRTQDGKLLPFRRGTMKVAQRAGLPIVPFTIDGTFRVYQQSKFAARPGPVRISFAAPISPNEASECSARELQERVFLTVATELGETPGVEDGGDSTAVRPPAVAEGV